MAYRVGGMPLATEVDAFQAEVGGDDEVVASRRAEDGAVITDACDKGPPRK